MGQRHQYIVTLPEVYYNPDNCNNKPAETGIIHHQWLYGYTAILTAARVLKLINRAGADNRDYLFGTDTTGNRLSDGFNAIAAAMSVDPETGYYHGTHIFDETYASHNVKSDMLDNNDGVTVIHVRKGNRKPSFCFATPAHLEGSNWNESHGQGPWTAEQYLNMYYSVEERLGMDTELQQAISKALQEIAEFSEPMSEDHLESLHPELRSPRFLKELQVIDSTEALQSANNDAPDTIQGAIVINGAQFKHVKGESVEILHNGIYNKFKVGDRAVYGSYNLVYTGIVVSIGAKTVSIKEEYENGRTHRLSFDKFVSYNRTYNLEKIAKRNSEWRD